VRAIVAPIETIVAPIETIVAPIETIVRSRSRGRGRHILRIAIPIGEKTDPHAALRAFMSKSSSPV
jgi:hypothetical protein